MAITPSFDPTTRAIATYLESELNAALDALSPGQIAVQGKRDFYSPINASDKFPLLMVYRVGGDQFTAQVRVEYYLPTYSNHFKQPGILNWARYEIIKALTGYNQPNCLKIDPTQPFTYQLLFAPLNQNIHPLLRVNFEIQEL